MNYHEPVELLDEETRDLSRALNSLKEEVEAVDWYNQRVNASKNEKLKKILAHNRDEEIEHAVMTIEWLRKNMPGWDEQLRKFLFSDDESETHTNKEQSNDLKIGDLK